MTAAPQVIEDHREREGAAARICYVDTSLRTDLGHHANACRQIAGELRRRGFAVDVYGHRGMSPAIAGGLGATALFRHAAYDNILAHAPIAALHRADYMLGRASFREDMKRLWQHGPYDLIYINSILPAQLAGLAQWLKSFPEAGAPPVAVEFGAPSGAGMTGRTLPGSLHWRHFVPLWCRAAGVLGGGVRLLLFTFDASASADYAQLLGRPVETMPAVHQGPAASRLRQRSNGRVTVAFLGHQRGVKGYPLVPEIVRRLESHGAPVRLLVHNGDPTDDPVSRELRGMAAGGDLVFEQKPAGGADWQDLLERSDLIVLPYEPARYRASYSAVAVEAVSAGIPLVVPAATTMETLARTYQAGATTFTEWEPGAIAGAIERAVSGFDQLAALAAAAAVRWREANGAGPFVDRLLELAPVKRTAAGSALSRPNRASGLALDVVFAATGGAVAVLRAVLR